MLAIIINEWKSFFRAKTFLYLNLFLVICLIAVTWLGVIQNQQQKKQQEAATKHMRQQWENLKPMNPHGAAHYGSYAFKPVTVLSSMDDGVNAITGNVLRLDGGYPKSGHLFLSKVATYYAPKWSSHFGQK